ncbi:hypothetical protein D9M69_667120 [compost metagenome]
MRFVFGAHRVVEHLHALAVFQRPVHQAGDARLDAAHQLTFTAGEKHAVAGAVGVEFFATGLGLHREGTRQARTGRIDERFALLVAQQPTQHHHPRQRQRREPTDLAVAGVQAQQ